MPFKVQIKAPAIREEIIRKQIIASRQAQDYERFHDFRNHESQLVRVRLPQDVLVYRMKNFRTFTDQRSYIAREKKAANFFASGQENESVQQVQHDILAKLARKGEGNTVVPVIDVLRTDGQTESLLITDKGVVVNGNRRLAAMRELRAEDENTFSEFSYVWCAVLPTDATAEEIVEVEAALQGKRETKLGYDWIGDAELIKELLSYGKSEKDIAARLNRRPVDIRNSMLALTEAELYLQDWKKAPGEYDRVRDSKQFFEDLPDQIKGKESDFAEASRVLAWSLHDNKNKLGDRLYAFNDAFGRLAGEVLDRLSADTGIAIEGETETPVDGFDVDVDIDSPTPTTYKPLTDAIRKGSDEIIERLIEISRGVLEEERGKIHGGAALKAIGMAHARLTSVSLGNADPKTYQGISRQLEQIAKRIGELKAELDKLIESNSGASGRKET